MWYEYEPLLTKSTLRSSPPRITSNPNAVYFPRYQTNSHSSAFMYPSWQTYISGMNDYHYQYEAQGFKVGLSPPSFQLDFLSSNPVMVNLRWTKWKKAFSENVYESISQPLNISDGQPILAQLLPLIFDDTFNFFSTWKPTFEDHHYNIINNKLSYPKMISDQIIQKGLPSHTKDILADCWATLRISLSVD